MNRFFQLVAVAILFLPGPARAKLSPAPFYFALAQAYSQEGAYREAFENFTKAVELAPNEPFIRLEFSEFLLRLGRLPAASEHAAAAHRLAPSNLDALRLHAHIQRRLGQESPEAMTRAIQALERLYELDPTDLDAAMTLAQIQMGEGEFDRAATMLEEALEGRRHPSIASLLFEALRRGGKAGRAEDMMRDYLESDPSHVGGWMALADLLSAQDRHAAAVEALRQVPEGGRDNLGFARTLALELYHSGDRKAALAEIETVLAAQPEDPQGRFLRASILASMENTPEAERELRALLLEPGIQLQAASLLADLLLRSERTPEAAEVLGTTADVLDRDGQSTAATQLLLQLVDLQARTANWPAVEKLTAQLAGRQDVLARDELHMVRAQALVELDRLPEALEVLEAIKTNSPTGARALASRAEVLYRVDRKVEAIDDLRRLGSSPKLDDLLLAAQSFQRLELHSEAIPLLVRAEKIQPESSQVLFWLGASYERDGQHLEAEEAFRRLLGSEPEFAPALNYLGYMWAERGENLGEALEMVLRAVALEPENGAYIDSLGWAYFQLGNFEKARGHLERAVALTGGDPVVFEHLGDLYQAVGELDQAREKYRRALELDAENAPQVRIKLQKLDG